MNCDLFARELKELCHRAGAPGPPPSLLSSLRPTVVLTPEWSTPPVAGGSKFGGAPDVPPDFAWPLLGGCALDFLAQFRLQDFPKSHGPEALPDRGMLYFFASVTEVGSGPTLISPEHYIVCYSESDSDLRPAAVPALDTPEELSVPEIALRGTVIRLPPVGHEDLWLLGATVEALNPAFWDQYGELVDGLRASAFPETPPSGADADSGDARTDGDGSGEGDDLNSEEGATWREYAGHLTEEARKKACSWTENLHQLLGYGAQLTSRRLYLEQQRQEEVERNLPLDSPDAARLAEGARNWRLLFQFDSDRDLGLSWGNEEFLQFWIREDDLIHRRFDQVRLTVGQ